MTSIRLFIELILYALTLWLGLYLIARNPSNLRLRYAGLGTVAYALSLALDLLVAYARSGAPLDGATPLWPLLERLHAPLLFLPALFWVRTTIELLPEDHVWREKLLNGWWYGLVPRRRQADRTRFARAQQAGGEGECRGIKVNHLNAPL